MNNPDDTNSTTELAYEKQDAIARKDFEKRWETTTPQEIANEKVQARQRFWQELAAHQQNTVITRGTETAHLRTVGRARDPEA